jgi:hypothetical protein
MAVRKSINLLPGVFQTDANEKFLSATLDQLISEPSLKNLYGYVGRKFSPTYNPGDSYVTEDTTERQNYQLEPSMIIKDAQGEISFFASYMDFLNQVKYYGGLTDNQSRLFNSEFYSFDPGVSFDKFVNFSQYYWLPNGPVAVEVNSTGVELIETFDVTRNDATNSYEFVNTKQTINTITVARGGTYTFNVSQDSDFWIQSESGISGKLRATPTLSSRDVLGVENNGAQTGQITFTVPQKDAQDRFINQTLTAAIDYATPTTFADLQNQYLSDFLVKFPSYSGIVQQFDGKQLIFVGQNQSQNLGEEAWTVGGNTNSFSMTYPKDSVVADALRFGIWQVQLINDGDDKLINLFYVRDVPFDRKVYIKYGIANANKEWYKEYDGFFHPIPLLSSLQDTLYIQDGTNPNIYATIKVVDYNNFVIDVENDIIGHRTYTSPNGIAFTSGLKIQFDVDVTPDSYKNKQYYVENVGDSINLVGVDLLVTPEPYNDELKTNYPINRIIIDQPTTASIPAGTTLTIGNNSIVTDKATLAGSTDITTLNSLQDEIGVNIIDYGMSVRGVGIATGTAVYDAFANEIFPDYITIKRDTKNRNAWSRNNRWFHVDVIKAAASYNSINLIIDQKLRAQRPIVQFEGDFQLFNEGRFGKAPIDILDTTTTDAFNALEGKILDFAFGVPLFDGMRVLFGVDEDPLVRNKIYVLNLVQYSVDNAGLPTGPYHIRLTKAEDGDGREYDTVVVKSGKYRGSQWWFDGAYWNQSQQKSQLQQDPIFDVVLYDPTTMSTGVSLSDLNTFPRSNFMGTRLFGYTRQHTAGLPDMTFDGINVEYINQTGTPDTILGFALKYRSLTTQGDIEFQNYFNTDTFTYVVDQVELTEKVNQGFLLTAVDSVDRTAVDIKNTWKTVVEPSKQYQILTFTYAGVSTFKLDITPEPTLYIPTVKVYLYTKDSQTPLKSTQWSLSTDNKLTVNVSLSMDDQIIVLVYSKETSQNGYFEVPQNLDLNAQNADIDTVTLGQMRNHLIALSRNSTTLIGNSILGANNLRDIEIKSQGGSILQHSSPIPYAELFLLDDTANFVEAVRYTQREYSKFKNKFLELASSLPGIQPTDPVISVDLILTEINKNKNISFPWFYSDMVPYGTLKYQDTITIYDPLTVSYKIRNVFLDTILSNQAVIIYYTPVATGIKRQLIKGIDFTFSTTSPSITINSNNLVLNVSDVLLIVTYADTDGCYVPETPTKVGAFPRFIPEIFLDDTYRAPIDVIRGHDGSLTPAFNDYRDDILLELEQRIYNNIKLPDTGTYQDIFTVAPGKFRELSGINDYDYQEVWSLLSDSFLTWVGNNKIDFTLNQTFESNDGFTWNYGDFIDRVDGAQLPGSWRACYQYFYDTFYPHTRPWEMLGFSAMPDWWESFYGPGPYTGGNALLWDDLEAGRIRFGPRSLIDDGNGLGIDLHFARPGLSQIIPVDENGGLLTPAQILAQRTNTQRAASAWSVGQLGPTEYAWRLSSDFPYAVQLALAMAKPATYFSQFIDTYNTYYNYNLGQFLTVGSNHHLRQTDVSFNGDSTSGTLNRGAGYLNWIADYLTSLGIDPASKILPMLQNYTLNLSYKMAGFSDQKYLQVLAEQSSPSSTSASVILPNQNYKVHLYKSSPVDKLVYSAVIVEKTDNGFSVRGYNLNNPYFTIIPSQTNSNAYQVSVLNSSGVIFNNYLNQKLTVPYGYEFTSTQQVVDFLISYQRYLLAQGFTFTAVNADLSETQDWQLSVKEFLFWHQQGWKTGSLLILSPTANSLSAITQGSIVDGISDSQIGSKILDQNFNLIKNTNYNVTRSPTNFSVTLEDPASVIAYAEFDLVQYEHILAFDNVTVFNDVIYEPQLGTRQYRLKIVGQKTDLWDGSLYAPGFVYNSKTVQSWVQGKDYLQGDLVIYKNQYYTALQNVTASVNFEFQYWKQLSNSQIQTGLLTNFSSIAVGSQSFYDSYGKIKDNDQLQYSHGLIGFRNRQYLADLGLSETTQIEFYKGFIGQKGTNNAVNALTKAQFNNLNSAIDYYEEWAVRVGEYGALGSNPYVEIALDEKTFSVNPQTAKFVNESNNNDGNGLTVFNTNQLYKSSYYHDNFGKFDGNIALTRDDSSNYESDILTAGYVNLEDIRTTIFDLNNYTDLNADLDNVGSGYTIWCAKDFTGDWNVYRITETENSFTELENTEDGKITWTTLSPHKLSAGELFVVKNFDDNTFDGYYRVDRIISLTKVSVVYLGDSTNLVEVTTIVGQLALFHILVSQRFVYMEDARVYGLENPKHLWQIGEKLWIDQDAAVDTVQGQPVNVPKGWKVYEKQFPWEYTQSLLKSESEYLSNDQFGAAVKLSYDNLLAIVGTPLAKTIPSWNLGVAITTGKVNTFNKNSAGEFVGGLSLEPDIGNATVITKEYGSSVYNATQTNGAYTIAVGAPGTFGNVGTVHIYEKPLGTTTYNKSQVIMGDVSLTSRFGTSVVLSKEGRWLFVGAPGTDANPADKVYVYGLNPHVDSQYQITSVNDENIIHLSGIANVTIGDIVRQPLTGGLAIVANVGGTGGNVYINTLTNFTSNVEAVAAGVNLANVGPITINNVDAGYWIEKSYHRSITNHIDLNFVPSVPNAADSLLITNSVRTFIPYVDYTLDDNGDGSHTVNFKGNTYPYVGNIAADNYTIQQKPYFTLQTILQGNVGTQFGYALASSLDGAQLAVGAPKDNVIVNGTTIVGAGTVSAYDRVIESFNSTGLQDYITTGNVDLTHRVTIDDVEVINYTTIPAIQIRFSSNISANVGDHVTQSTTGANAIVVAGANEGNVLTVRYTSSPMAMGNNGNVSINGTVVEKYNPVQKQIYFNGNITATVGQYITQIIGNDGNVANLLIANAIVTANSVGNTVTISYTNANTFILTSNVQLAGNVISIGNLVANVGVRITFSSNISANVGQLVSQDKGSGNYANATVILGTNSGNILSLSYANVANIFVLGPSSNVRVGNVTITSYANVYPTTTSNISASPTTSIDIGVYPLTSTTVGQEGLRFDDPPAIGKVINIETNEFRLLEQLTGVSDLVGGTDSIQTDAAFGTSITICFDNCAIYVGAPGYSKYPLYNTGGAFKFHNKGRLYGINTGYVVDPTFTPGDSIRINNFEITVTPRMMPTITSSGAAANILVLSQGITANIGHFIRQPSSGANVRVMANVINSKFVTVSGYSNIANTFNFGQSISGANVVTVGNAVASTATTAFPKVSLDSLIKDINDAGIVGISAYSENGALTIKSNSTVARKYLQLLAGNKQLLSPGVFAEADLRIFAFMQIMTSPYPRSGEYFGSKVVLAQNAYSLAIGSARGTTEIDTTFDNTNTILDDRSTIFREPVTGSGSMYIFELYDDPRDAVEHPGRYQFAQQLDPGSLTEGDKFGTAFDLIGNQILVSAPGSDKLLQDSGTLYLFDNPTGGRGWKLIRYQEPRVDLESMRRMYLYSDITNTILTNLEIIDPVKGRILGQADQEITWKSVQDPAIYNRGSKNPNPNLYWNSNQVSQVWWNLKNLRYIDYEQSDLTYRSINWGNLFPGSVVEVCEWVESTVLPSQYIAAGYDGIPKYADNSAYVEITHVDPTTNIIGSLYYFWVTGKTSITGVNPRRELPIQTIADYITNPKGQGIPYAAAIQNNAVIVYNISNYLSAKNTILHIDYEVAKNTNVIHSEYALLQNGNPISFIPEKIVNKLIDSLAGLDGRGSVVPDPTLSIADRYGIGIRPRQIMFVNRLAAMKDLVEYVNSILLEYPIERQYSLNLLSSEEPRPSEKLNEYDLKVATEIDLSYIDTVNLPAGYKVLVDQDTGQDNLWVLYILNSNKTWSINKIQSYKSTLYWEYVDWFARKPDGVFYSLADKLDFVVDSLPDALKLPVIPGVEILVRVNTSTVDTGWNLFTVNDKLELQLVGIENGTIQLKKALGNFADNGLGYNNQGFDSARFDQNPNVETRYIIQALREEVFVGELQGKFNNLFFVMVNYLFNEQKYVDWIFKTSFTSITHDLRALNQPAYYINDNLTYYEDYINEVKPFRTTIREYLTRYTGNDAFQGSLTDFDLASYYDTEMKIFRSPSGEEVAKDEQLWATGYNGSTLVNADYTNWYNNRDLIVDRIEIVNGGSGYTQTPIITITGGGTGSTPATAVARINPSTGAISSITVTNPGKGYFTTPTVTINGSTGGNVVAYGNAVVNASSYTYSVSTVSGLFAGMSANAVFAASAEISSIDKANLQITMTSGNLISFAGQAISFGYPGLDVGASATAYAVLKNYQVRSFDTKIKFDRINYKTTVQPWASNTVFLSNTIVTYAGHGYRAVGNVTTGNTFSAIPFALTSSEDFDNANDRIMAYYQPTNTMPVIGVISVPLTLANSSIYSTVVNITNANANLSTNTYGVTSIQDLRLGMVPNINFNSSHITNINSANLTITMSGSNTASVFGANLSFTVNDNTIYVFPQDAMIKGMYISGNGVKAGQITKILGNANILLDGVNSTVSQVTLSVNVTLLTDQTITATYNSMDQLISGINYPNLPMTGYNFKVSPLFGLGFDDTAYDPVVYSRDGAALLSSSTVDVAHSSLYTNILLGTNPEDITPDGGSYIDRYHSRAPEELVPGIMFDTLSMKIFTANVTTSSIDVYNNVTYSNVIVGYRQFTDMVGSTTYTRISDYYTTYLTQDLLITDTEIVINDSSMLHKPSIIYGNPGVVFIGGERIVYWRNYAKEVTPWLADTDFAANVVISYSGNTYITTAAVNSTTFDLGNVRQLPSVNILGQIRRGTLGTGTPAVHVNSTTVIDASAEQVVPTTGNLVANIQIWYNAGDTITTATDGLGFAASTTEAVNFLREYNANTSGTTASAPTNALIIEAADASVNALYAEDGVNIIITE